MKIIGVIPARYKSSRFPGKPLVEICGKPMIYWVYHQAIKSRNLTKFTLPQMMKEFVPRAKNTT